MSKPLVVSIPHKLGAAEATRRIKEGLNWAREKYGTLFSMQREDWTGNELAFRVGALGQAAEGTILVSDSDVTLTVQLPWLLARFAAKAQAVLQQQGQVLLEKK